MLTRFMRRGWFLLFPALALLAGIGLLTGGAFARVPAGSTDKAAASPLTVDAFAYLSPGAAGNCPAPPNGGTTTVGCRFVLNVRVNTGSNQDATAHQDVISFTYSILQVARVSLIGSSCVPTSTLTPDLTTFDSVKRNEVCNGPGSCVFHGITFDPGLLAYAEGCLNCDPVGGDFRVAQMGLCATAPGQAILHWQFNPGDFDHDSEIVNLNGDYIHNPALYTDYVINVVAPTNTPTPTPTFAPTRIPAGNARHFLQPGAAGNCSAPPNGGTTTVGCGFVLDMMIDAGSSQESCAQQGYLQVSSQLIKNARVSSIGSSCVLTSTATADLVTYDCLFQNEICNGTGPNGDQPCVFRGVSVNAGSYAFASGALANPPTGGIFRVARIGLCAVAPGQAVFHWQFSPPDPITRDTEIVDINGLIINDPLLYTDYVINIVAPVIVGHINWQGAPAQPNSRQMQPITLTLKMGTTEVNFPSQNTDAYGFFTYTLPTLPNGVYNWRVKGPKFLAGAGNVTLSGAPTTSFEASLMRAGDANDDNVVNITDFNILKNTFGKTVGDPGYDARADFNNDTVVNAQDTNLHKINQGTSGAPPIRPNR